jgi:ATP synthase F1 delta subunit
VSVNRDDLKLSDFDEVNINFPGRAKTSFKLSKNGWKMVAPYQTRADEFYVYRILSLLAAKNRLAILAATGEQYVRLYAQTQGEVTAIVTTAIKLTPSLKQLVLEKAKGITKENVQLENKIDPEIIGGFILKIGDLQYDASVSHQLKSIKTTLINTNSI